MYQHQEAYEVKAMCNFFGISRAAYYKWVKRSVEPDKDAEYMTLVREVWLKSRKTYGYRRVTISLQQQGHSINHKAVLRLMQKMNICSVARKRKPYKKMSQLDSYHRYGNILDCDFSATAPNQKWVTDISYIRTRQGWAYPIYDQRSVRWFHCCLPTGQRELCSPGKRYTQTSDAKGKDH